MSELDLIEWLKGLSFSKDHVIEGIGDDCAILKTSKSTLVTTDMLMDGSHFDCKTHSPEQIGHKCLAVNLSDIASMGGTPTSIFLSLAIPKGTDQAWLKDMLHGMHSLCQEFGISLAGGDTNSWNGPLAVNITALGLPPAGGAILRSTANPGDKIFVTGDLGYSFDSHHHLNFSPRVLEGQYLAKHFRPTSMIDLSDGLATDLRHLLNKSGCGATIDLQKLPIHPLGNKQPSHINIQHALNDGEDFQLCFTLAPHRASEFLQDKQRPFKATLIGEITEHSGFFGRDEKNRLSEVESRGYEHRF